MNGSMMGVPGRFVFHSFFKMSGFLLSVSSDEVCVPFATTHRKGHRVQIPLNIICFKIY